MSDIETMISNILDEVKKNGGGTIGLWGNLISVNTLVERWPGATRRDIVSLISDKLTKKPCRIDRGEIQIYSSLEQPKIFLFLCIKKWDNGKSELYMFSRTERVKICKENIDEIPDDIVVIESYPENIPEEDRILSCIADIEKDHPEYLIPLVQNNMRDMQQEWEKLASRLKDGKRNAALLAAKKCNGASHVKAYQAVFPEKNISEESMTKYVNKQRPVAEKLASDNGLKMPPWKTR